MRERKRIGVRDGQLRDTNKRDDVGTAAAQKRGSRRARTGKTKEGGKMGMKRSRDMGLGDSSADMFNANSGDPEAVGFVDDGFCT